MKGRPDEVKRVVRALQTAKSMMLKVAREILGPDYPRAQDGSRDSRGHLQIGRVELQRYGNPSPEGMANIVKSIKAEGRFTDRIVSFEEVAEPRSPSRLLRS
jgi:hypothetical protein